MEIVGFAKSFDRSGFRCGKPDLDEWLQKQAGQQERSNNTRTFLGIVDDNIVGYYASTTYRLDLNEAARAFGAGKRRYPVSAVLLARLAVDERHQAKGYGRRLLVHALTEFAKASVSVGFEVVVVHAIDPDAVTFYACAGFERFEDHPLHLFMPTQNLVATVSGQ